jgi:hypothetical protein
MNMRGASGLMGAKRQSWKFNPRELLAQVEERRNSDVRRFTLATAQQPFPGIGIITGANPRGETISATTPPNPVLMSAMFAEAIDGNRYETATPWGAKA